MKRTMKTVSEPLLELSDKKRSQKMPSTDINGEPILILTKQEAEHLEGMMGCDSPFTIEEEKTYTKVKQFLEETCS